MIFRIVLQCFYLAGSLAGHQLGKRRLRVRADRKRRRLDKVPTFKPLWKNQTQNLDQSQ